MESTAECRHITVKQSKRTNKIPRKISETIFKKMGSIGADNLDLEREVVERVKGLYGRICKLQGNLKPSKNVNALFGELVGVCGGAQGRNVRVDELPSADRVWRFHLIQLCSESEGELEKHYSRLLGNLDQPCSPETLTMFPYYDNYVKLSKLEYTTLCMAAPELSASKESKRVAFFGSGPLPLSTIVMAMANYFGEHAVFDNYDMDSSANDLARKLVEPHEMLANKMFFHDKAVEEVTESEMMGYDVVFLAALVGLEGWQKKKVAMHVSRCMRPGALLVIRSAYGARAFLYPVVDVHDHLQTQGFRVLSIVHPSDDVINSVIVARKL